MLLDAMVATFCIDIIVIGAMELVIGILGNGAALVVVALLVVEWFLVGLLILLVTIIGACI